MTILELIEAGFLPDCTAKGCWEDPVTGVRVWPKAKAVLFIAGRLYFCFPDGTQAKGNAGGPSALIAYSDYDAEVLRRSGIAGCLVIPERPQIPLVCITVP